MPLAFLETVYKKDGSIKREELAYITVDHLNTPRFAANDNQEIVWTWRSDAFGVGSIEKDPDGDGTKINIKLRFPGQYEDGESGLHYNYYRDYHPGWGRYVQSDPIGLSGGINTYGYVSGNPVRYIDPQGLTQMERSPFAPGGSLAPPGTPPKGVGVFGCIGGCLSYVNGLDSEAQASLSPTIGGGVLICSEPTDSMDKDQCNQGNTNIYDPNGDNSLDFSASGGFKGAGLGISVRNDGAVCISAGAFVGLPIPIAKSLGGINE